MRAALERLELVADTFLSVGGPVQHALNDLLALGPAFRDAATERTRANLATLRDAARGTPLSVLRAPAGWTAVVRVPGGDDERLAAELLRRTGVLVHPGSFFGFRFSAFVVSLLPQPATFTEGAALLRDAFLGPFAALG